MKKLTIIITLFIAVTMILAGCGSSQSSDDDTKEEVKPSEQTIDINQNIQLTSSYIEVVKAVVKDNVMNISLIWHNTAGKDPQKFATACIGVEAVQAGTNIPNTNPESSNAEEGSGSYWFPNARGGSVDIPVTFDLVNDTDPVTVNFVPGDELETQTLTINLSE